MKNHFNIKEERAILGTGLGRQVEPVPHPNRVMTRHYFLYLLEGSWGIGQNGVNYEMVPDDVLIMPAGEYQHAVSDTLPITKYVHILTSVMDGDCYSNDTFDDSEYISLDTKISCRGYDAPKKLFQEIAVESFAKNKYYNIKLSSLFKVLLCELSRINTNDATIRSTNFFNNAIRMMSQNPDKFYKIKELAEIFSVAEPTVKNMFFKHTGEPVHAYQIKKKIELIKMRMRTEPNLTMKMLSREYGFCDEFHFSKIFKKYVGLSPTEYISVIQ